jgi:hypothetical protein
MKNNLACVIFKEKKWEFSDQEFSALLVSSDFTKSVDAVP